ncbi:hypothetical protein CIK75_11120 [Glutamicibacter sp. BW78]|uniref:PD-(D/E)XK motif protein n=1 Tax=Glutamicibacter sp. BW78 TaxID=2024403 RepID=UPI000BB6F02E|nr:PD-(D/E)XK motif protein [Glutamicibacter sp. BW78]PCC24721.1 hypothetical protein CIK75_11120 [Glutamicibacter sp. BW78]
MHSPYSVKSAWGALSSEAAKSSGRVLCLGLGRQVEAGECVAALRSDGGFQVLVPLGAAESIASSKEDARIAVVVEEIDSIRYVGVTCKEPSLNDVFLVFAGDLLEQLPSSGNASTEVVQHVERWRSLFAMAEESAVLSLPQQLGLLGELMILERIVQNDPARRTDVWSGPLKHRHDFRLPGCAIEAKSTLAANGMRAKINGQRQLEAEPDGELFVSFMRFESAHEGRSIPDQIDRIRDLNVDGSELDKKLLQAGYREKYRGIYDNSRFALIDSWLFDVESENFPKLVPAAFAAGKFPAGIENVSYTIDLVGVVEAALDLDEAESLMRRMAKYDHAS